MSPLKKGRFFTFTCLIQIKLEDYFPENGFLEWTQLLLQALETVDRNRMEGKYSLDSLTLSQFEERYMELVKKGLEENPLQLGLPHKRGKKPQTKPRNLLDRLNKYKDEVLIFMYDFTVPFTNNQAERDLRMVKVKLKVSGCFRSDLGLDVYCRIRSYISTAMKNGVDAYQSIVDAFNGRPFIITPRCAAMSVSVNT